MLKNLLLISVLTLFTVIMLIAFNVIHGFTSTKISEDVSKTVTPINPTFDSEAISLLENRKVIQADLQEKIVAIPTPTTTARVSSASAEVKPTGKTSSASAQTKPL